MLWDELTKASGAEIAALEARPEAQAPATFGGWQWQPIMAWQHPKDHACGWRLAQPAWEAAMRYGGNQTLIEEPRAVRFSSHQFHGLVRAMNAGQRIEAGQLVGVDNAGRLIPAASSPHPSIGIAMTGGERGALIDVDKHIGGAAPPVVSHDNVAYGIGTLRGPIAFDTTVNGPAADALREMIADVDEPYGSDEVDEAIDQAQEDRARKDAP